MIITIHTELKDNHAEKYYESVRNRDKSTEINKIYITAQKYELTKQLTKEDIEKIYEHVFINEYDLDNERKDLTLTLIWHYLGKD